MRRKLIGLGVLLLGLIIAGTSYIATLTPDVHAALMQQVADSGLAQDQDVQFKSGWLTAHSQGRIRLAASLCRSCQVLDYQGTIHHGLGAWLMGDLALASAHYAITLPELPLEPAMPPLHVRAVHNLRGTPAASIGMPASAHRYSSGSNIYLFAQGGITGELKPGQMALQSPALSLSRNEFLWFTADELQLQAAADQLLQLDAQATRLQIPAWDWIGQNLSLHYEQASISENLSFSTRLMVESGQIGSAAVHQSMQGTLEIQRLHLESTRAFVQELPRLLADSTSPAARMLGLFSLYSVHGPDFFGSAPALALDLDALPLQHGVADVHLNVAVTPGTRRPPMHPVEWQRALQGKVDVLAPRQHLAQWWPQWSSWLSAILPLPRSYELMLAQGWIRVAPDGRDHLYIELNPTTGLRPAP